MKGINFAWNLGAFPGKDLPKKSKMYLTENRSLTAIANFWLILVEEAQVEELGAFDSEVLGDLTFCPGTTFAKFTYRATST